MTSTTARDGRPITLRRSISADAEQIWRWRSEVEVRRHQPIQQVSLAQVLQRVIEWGQNEVTPGAGGEIQWLIEAAGKPVGWVKLNVYQPEHGVAELGYSLGAAFHGQGLMLPAVRQVLAIGFGEVDGLALARIEARASVANRASRSILTRAGFIQEGVIRQSAVINGERVDHAVYGLLRREWTAGLETDQ